MKVITKEQMEKILATFLRNGYSVDSINDDTYQWYLGWMNYGEDRVTLPLESPLYEGSFESSQTPFLLFIRTWISCL